MVDIIDRAQQRQLDEIEHALASHKAAAKAGTTHCQNLDCGEPITEVRQRLGAELCIDCAREAEARASQWTKPRG